MSQHSRVPYPDVPRLIAKARGGIAYMSPHPGGLSALDRYNNLWRAAEYMAGEQGKSTDAIIDSALNISAQTMPAVTPAIRNLGKALIRVSREDSLAMDDYVDSRQSAKNRDGAKNHLLRSAREVEGVSERTGLNLETQKCAKHLLVALRNAVTHAGAMSSTESGSIFQEGCVLLDQLVCVAYGAMNDVTSSETERIISAHNPPSSAVHHGGIVL